MSTKTDKYELDIRLERDGQFQVRELAIGVVSESGERRGVKMAFQEEETRMTLLTLSRLFLYMARATRQLFEQKDKLDYSVASMFSDEEFRELLNVLMASDPVEAGVVVDMLNVESRLRGYAGWIQAYHEFQYDPGNGGV